ncbi:unnamed protein product [Prorocentrum cordatum]|uniref:SET domain-containing protein n=1 Tax=Prorocentrum cordatum TaxID=2364126 RepID=A0ABN9RNL3_9DINO|nr:unnamed protein product [Polarella glacialis]
MPTCGRVRTLCCGGGQAVLCAAAGASCLAGTHPRSGSWRGSSSACSQQLRSSGAFGGSCVPGPSRLGGRGLFAVRQLSPGQRLFSEQAVLDSVASDEVLRAVFSEPLPPGAVSGSEPIWGLAANFVLALSASAAAGDQVPSESCSFGALRDFHRPPQEHGGEAPGLALCRAHGQHLHDAMLPAARAAVTAEVLADLLHVTRLNAHNVRVVRQADSTGESAQTREMGLGLFFQLHLANHSCVPNAYFSARHGAEGHMSVMTLFAIRPVAEGEEVHISYIGAQDRTGRAGARPAIALDCKSEPARRSGFFAAAARGDAGLGPRSRPWAKGWHPSWHPDHLAVSTIPRFWKPGACGHARGGAGAQSVHRRSEDPWHRSDACTFFFSSARITLQEKRRAVNRAMRGGWAPERWEETP